MVLQLPFRFVKVDRTTILRFYDGRIISAFDLCGMFVCTRGEVEILFGESHYVLRRGDMYIYMPSTLVHLLRKSDDAEGMMVEVEMGFVLPVVTAQISVENLLYIRQHPCVTLGEEQLAHVYGLMQTLCSRMEREQQAASSPQRVGLVQGVLRSMAQTLCYEVLDAYFAHRPLQPMPQDKKDRVFHHFMLALFSHYSRHRDVAFYASLQHLAPRYFSTLIRERSGSSPLQWIAQMVITESRQLLEATDLSIKEIALRLNFPTQSFFGKYFKQYVGISPKEYRARLHASPPAAG